MELFSHRMIRYLKKISVWDKIEVSSPSFSKRSPSILRVQFPSTGDAGYIQIGSIRLQFVADGGSYYAASI